MRNIKLAGLPYKVKRRAERRYVEFECRDCGSVSQLNLTKNLPSNILAQKIIERGWQGAGHVAKEVPAYFVCPKCVEFKATLRKSHEDIVVPEFPMGEPVTMTTIPNVTHPTVTDIQLTVRVGVANRKYPSIFISIPKGMEGKNYKYAKIVPNDHSKTITLSLFEHRPSDMDMFKPSRNSLYCTINHPTASGAMAVIQKSLSSLGLTGPAWVPESKGLFYPEWREKVTGTFDPATDQIILEMPPVLCGNEAKAAEHPERAMAPETDIGKTASPLKAPKKPENRFGYTTAAQAAMGAGAHPIDRLRQAAEAMQQAIADARAAGYAVQVNIEDTIDIGVTLNI